jgi:alanine dehydrogenase
MKISVLKESKNREARVALTPANVAKLTRAGHEVFVQRNAGVGSSHSDQDYVKAGGTIVASAQTAIKKSDLVIKVKEPTLDEVAAMRAGQIFFGYLHLAALPALTKAILKRKIIALGYETLRLSDGSLPLLAPMSEIAGKLAAQNGAWYLRADQGGRGVLIGGAAGAPEANVLVLGGGVVGSHAARVAIGMGAHTTILDIDENRLQRLKTESGGILHTAKSDPATIASLLPQSDIVIGAVLIPGAKAPRLVSEKQVKSLRLGSVIVDVAVDQGGCIETSRVTTHEHPVFIKHKVLHYGVANMPGAVPVTATAALTAASFPYILSLANLGYEAWLRHSPETASAVNVAAGEIVHPALRG